MSFQGINSINYGQITIFMHAQDICDGAVIRCYPVTSLTSQISSDAEGFKNLTDQMTSSNVQKLHKFDENHLKIRTVHFKVTIQHAVHYDS